LLLSPWLLFTTRSFCCQRCCW